MFSSPIDVTLRLCLRKFGRARPEKGSPDREKICQEHTDMESGMETFLSRAVFVSSSYMLGLNFSRNTGSSMSYEPQLSSVPGHFPMASFA